MNVFPAPAGVILSVDAERGLCICLSRASGGDPRLTDYGHQYEGSFPRQRG